MKKRIEMIGAILLSLCCTVCLMPAMAFAAQTYDIWVNDEQITDDNLTVTCGSGTAVYDPTGNTLTLNNAEITSGCSLEYLGSGILSRMDDLTIVLNGSSTITNTGGAGIDTYDTDSITYELIPHDLTITGNGTLTIRENTPYYGYGIYCTGNLTLDGVNLDITSASSSLWANSNISIENSTITATAVTVTVDVMGTSKEISGNGLVTNKGNITIDNSIVSATSEKTAAVQLGNSTDPGSLQIKSGSLTLNGKYGISAEDGVISTVAINGGRVKITADTAAVKLEPDSITFNNGTGEIAGTAAGTDYVFGVPASTAPVALPVSSIETAADLNYILRPGLSAQFTPSTAITADTMGENDGLRIDYYNPMLKSGGWDPSSHLSSGYTKLVEYIVQFSVADYENTTLSGTVTLPLPEGYDGATAKIAEGGASSSAGTAETVTFPVTLNVNEGTAIVDFIAEYQAVKSHTHIYGTEWKTDGSNHWHECSCGEKADVAAHTAGDWVVDTAATVAAAGSRHKACTVCGYVMQTEVIPATGALTDSSTAAPMTGDTGDPARWISLLITGAGAAAIVTYIKKRKNRVE